MTNEVIDKLRAEHMAAYFKAAEIDGDCDHWHQKVVAIMDEAARESLSIIQQGTGTDAYIRNLANAEAERAGEQMFAVHGKQGTGWGGDG